MSLPSHHHGIQRHSSSSYYSSVAADQMQVVDHLSSISSRHLSSSSYSSSSADGNTDAYSLPLDGRNWTSHAAASRPIFKFFNPLSAVASVFRSFFPALQSVLIPTCQWLAIAPNRSRPITTPRTTSTSTSTSRNRPLTGTFFGQKKGRVSFAVQETPRSEPILLLELATSTSHLVKEMASGMVRILLECERSNHAIKKSALWDEPVWTMYCNGHKLGHAISRECKVSDFHVLSTVQTVSVGAGVMPAAPTLPPPAGPSPIKASAVKNSDCGAGAQPEIMYMRAKFDRVIGSRDSEAFYMINPDCAGGKFNNGGPELSIFLLRI